MKLCFAIYYPMTYARQLLVRYAGVESQSRLHLDIRALELTRDGIAIQSLLTGDGPKDSSELPTWSVLRASTSVPEELCSPLARSIVAGEFVCRLASAIAEGSRADKLSNERSFWSNIAQDYRSAAWAELGSDGGRRRVQELIAIWLPDEPSALRLETIDLSSRLIARAELSFILSSYAHGCEAGGMIDHFGNWPTLSPPRSHIVLRKMHLLAQYIAVSYSHIWSENVIATGEVARNSRPTTSRGYGTQAYVRPWIAYLCEFDRSVEIIARQVNGSNLLELPDLARLRSRVSSITTEILSAPNE